jgi:hypothetical protein
MVGGASDDRVGEMGGGRALSDGEGVRACYVCLPACQHAARSPPLNVTHCGCVRGDGCVSGPDEATRIPHPHHWLLRSDAN